MAKTTDRSVWVIDPVHSKFRFEVRYLLLTSVSGWFPDIEGTVVCRQPDFTDNSIDITVYTHALYTGNEARDSHLRSSHFLDTDNYPVIRFKSVSALGNGEHIEADGLLTIKGITRAMQVTVAFAGISLDSMDNTKAGFRFSTVLSRRDFDMTWNKTIDTGGVVLDDPVNVYGDIQLIRVDNSGKYYT